MKTIRLQRIKITNFKGIKSLEIRFDDQQTTTIYGKNTSGKTTIADAYRWLLIGKDSLNRADFEIRPTDKNGNIIHKVESEVEADINVEGKKITLRRVNKEKWSTPRGSDKEVLKGNETSLFIDDVPYLLKDYQKRIFTEIMDEEQIKILTDTNYFNDYFNWQDKRRVLTEMAGEITDQDILEKFKTANDTFYSGLIIELLNSGKSFSDRKREIGLKRKLLLDEKVTIPTRIDEATKAKPVPLPFGRLREDMGKISIRLQTIDKDLFDINEQYKRENEHFETIRRNIQQSNSILMNIENEHTRAYNLEKSSTNISLLSIQDKIKKQKDIIAKLINSKQGVLTHSSQIQSQIQISQNKIQELQADKQAKREEWMTVNAEQLTLDETDFSCPTCNRQLEHDTIEEKRHEMMQSFSYNKSQKLKALVSKADTINKQIDQLNETVSRYNSVLNNNNETISAADSDIQNHQSELEILEAELQSVKNSQVEEVVIKSVEDRLLSDKGYQAEKAKIEELKEQLTSNSLQVDTTDLQAEKAELQSKYNDMIADLEKEKQIVACEERIEDLKNQEKALAQEIAKMEAEDFAIANFLKIKMDMVQESVNSLFSIAKFRMYRDLINGGEEPCCDCLVDGIEYEKNLNKASKVNAGIDIINALSTFYKVSAPIFIDNRESTTEIIHTDNQVINLVVWALNDTPSTEMKLN